MLKRITIVGPGLLGASLGMVVHARELTRQVSVWARREESRDACLQAPWCQVASGDLEEALEGAELAILCTPVVHLSELIGSIGKLLPENCLLTDVGSTKVAICRAAADANLNNFVGAHPIAGSEKTGIEHARSDLFDDRPCFVTPTEGSDPNLTKKVAEFWKSLGMRIIQSSPEEHDRILAHVSHLPHFLASALCNLLASKPQRWRDGSGQGLRDATRIAAGSPTLWRDIAQQNRKEIIGALDALDTETRNLRKILEENDSTALFRWLEKGKAYRDSIA